MCVGNGVFSRITFIFNFNKFIICFIHYILSVLSALILRLIYCFLRFLLEFFCKRKSLLCGPCRRIFWQSPEKNILVLCAIKTSLPALALQFLCGAFHKKGFFHPNCKILPLFQLFFYNLPHQTVKKQNLSAVFLPTLNLGHC